MSRYFILYIYLLSGRRRRIESCQLPLPTTITNTPLRSKCLPMRHDATNRHDRLRPSTAAPPLRTRMQGRVFYLILYISWFKGGLKLFFICLYRADSSWILDFCFFSWNSIFQPRRHWQLQDLLTFSKNWENFNPGRRVIKEIIEIWNSTVVFFSFCCVNGDRNLTPWKKSVRS